MGKLGDQMIITGNRIEVGSRVRIKYPAMVGREWDFGTVIKIDGAYISVNPDTWPTEAYIEFYPNELELVERKP